MKKIASELPGDLIIPAPFSGKQAEYEDWQPALIYIGRRYPSIETPEGHRTITEFSKVINAIKAAKHTFAVTEPGEFDAMFRWFPRHVIFALDAGLTVTIDGWEVFFRGSNIRIKKGNQNHYLWNLWRFYLLPSPPDTLEEVDGMVHMLLHHLQKNKISFSSFSSPAAISRHMMITYAFPEFISRPKDYERLNDFYKACHGGRSESVGIGSKIVWNYDMKNAHLNLMSKMPSMRGTQYREDWPYIAEASYGSYLIEAKIPQMKLCPLPVELNSGYAVEVVYPYGSVTDWYAKPFLDLLVELDLQFKVIRSHQYVPVKHIKPPFKECMAVLRKFLNNAPSYLNSKAFYYGMAGSTISWRYVIIDEETGEYAPRAFNVFNPVIYSHVLAAQTVRVYREAHKANPIAIRSDAVTVDKSIWTGLRKEDSGLMTFINPLFKVFPSGRGAEWMGFLLEAKDKSYFDYSVSEYPTIAKHLRTDKPLGKMAETNMRIKAHHGKRRGLIPKTIGHLLNSWYPSRAPSIDDFQL